MRRPLLVPLLSFLSLVAGGARAQPADARVEAERLFEAGLRDVKRSAWAEALAEFRGSLDRSPTRSATTNVAVCLEKLGRFDEALDVYDYLLERFRDLSDDDRASVGRERSRIERFIGAIAIDGGVPGAQVIVDGRLRGTLPLDGPIRVSVGTRVVRLTMPGWASFEVTARVASGETARVSATLAMVVQRGRLRVVEEGGRVFEVRVDGAPVGTSPWEAEVAKGEHVVALRGPHDTGSTPTAVDVAAGATTNLTLRANVLPAVLRVEPSPTSASVAVDGSVVSRGTWSGTVPSGTHVVDVVADWHDPVQVRVAVSSGEPQTIRPSLERVRRLYIELFGGVTLRPIYGVTGPDDCSGGCIGQHGGVRAGWLVAPRIGVEMFVNQTNNHRDSDVHLQGGSTFTNQADVSLSGGGVSARYQWLDRTPVTVRVSAGLDLGTALGVPFWTPFAGPEARFGVRISRTVLIDAGAAALLFTMPAVAARPFQVQGVPFNGYSGGLGVAFPVTAGLHLDF